MFLPLHDRNPMRFIRFAYVTYTLMAVNIAVFGLQMALHGPAGEALASALGMVPALVSGAAPPHDAPFPDQLTLVTYAFLHVDWLHVLTNMLFLWIFGDNIEDALGHVRFIAFYLACAVAAALAQLLSDPSSPDVLIGASGAVAGVMGAYVLLYPHARVYVLARIVIPIPLPVPAMWMLGLWIATQLLYALIGSPEPIAWWAHLGGFVAGVLLGWLMRRRGVPLFGG